MRSAVLDRAVKADAAPIVLMLAARAHAAAGDLAGARPLYERALANDKDSSAVEVALDWAASELAPAAIPAIAVTALEQTAPAAQDRSARRAPQGRARRRSPRRWPRRTARRQRHQGRSSSCAPPRPPANTLATRCDLAVAAVVAGDTSAALTALKAITGQSLSVPGTGRHPGRADPDRVHRRAQSAPRRQGAREADLARRQVHRPGGGAARHGDPRRRAQGRPGCLPRGRARRRAQVPRDCHAPRTRRSARDEVAHNLAVLDLADGKLDAAIAQLERLAPKLPEALVNLGIAYERKGDHVQAPSMPGAAPRRPACGSVRCRMDRGERTHLRRRRHETCAARDFCVRGRVAPPHADTLTVGLFAPTAPFPSTAARVELASKLAEPSARPSAGRRAARSSRAAADFAAAVKKGDVRSRSSMRRTSRTPAATTPCSRLPCAVVRRSTAGSWSRAAPTSSAR